VVAKPYRIIKNKLGLLNLVAEPGNVSTACKVMGSSRDTFYRYKDAVEAGGIEALAHQSRRKPNRKNRTDEATESTVVACAIEFPAYGQVSSGQNQKSIPVPIH
jgi:transposase